MEVKLNRENLASSQGPDVSEANCQWVQSLVAGFVAGHILAKAAGGSGTDRRSMFAQNSGINNDGFKAFETHVRNVARLHQVT